MQNVARFCANVPFFRNFRWRKPLWLQFCAAGGILWAEGGSTMRNCCDCGTKLSTNEIAISLRLLGRATERVLCTACLARQLRVDRELIERKIEQFRALGCPLFV